MAAGTASRAPDFPAAGKDTSIRMTHPSNEISLYAPLRVLLQARYFVVLGAIAVACLAVLPPFFGARSYTSTAAFMPQGTTGAGGGGLAAAAGQFGINLRPVEATQSPQFYAEIATSRELLARLVADTFTVSTEVDGERTLMSGTLADLRQVEADSPEHRRERTLRMLSDEMISVNTTSTGMVRLAVTSPWPELSEAIATRVIELVNDFNLRRRQSNAAAESQFVRERLAAAEASLRGAEDELRAFLESNRQFQNSPQLVFEHDRFQREVLHRQQLYTRLQESYEDAQIAEVRDTPLITVVEQPERPVFPNSRRLPLRGLLGLFAGALIAFLIAFVRELAVRTSEDRDPEYERLQTVWADTLADFRLAPRGSSSRQLPRTVGNVAASEGGRNSRETS
jgi:uncharacterized protein involved in exopolysaccharide biosynthesis